MPTVSLDLDEELYEWLAQRAEADDTSVAAELAALAAAARCRESADEPTTGLPVGVYEADDGTTVVELGDPAVDDTDLPVDETDLPVGVYHDDEEDD